jgi:hypothetical protein
MADGTFAALLLVAGLIDMGTGHCGTAAGCLGATRETPRLAISAGEVLERRATPGAELYLRFDTGLRTGPFGHAAGLSVGERGELWAGFGATWDTDFGGSPFYAELHAMTGLYAPGDGLDLGGPIAFRSGVELGWEASSGWRVGLAYDHRSNAGIYDRNPGVETVQLRVSVPLK